MKIKATQGEESIVCTLPKGEEIEIIMVSAEGNEYHAAPDLNSARNILMELDRGESHAFGAMLEKKLRS